MPAAQVASLALAAHRGVRGAAARERADTGGRSDAFLTYAGVASMAVGAGVVLWRVFKSNREEEENRPPGAGGGGVDDRADNQLRLELESADCRAHKFFGGGAPAAVRVKNARTGAFVANAQVFRCSTFAGLGCGDREDWVSMGLTNQDGHLAVVARTAASKFVAQKPGWRDSNTVEPCGANRPRALPPVGVEGVRVVG